MVLEERGVRRKWRFWAQYTHHTPRCFCCRLPAFSRLFVCKKRRPLPHYAPGCPACAAPAPRHLDLAHKFCNLCNSLYLMAVAMAGAQNNDKYPKYVRKLVAIQAFGDFCVLATKVGARGATRRRGCGRGRCGAWGELAKRGKGSR